ncbi:hypothetical protein J3A69_001782 [Pseudomonas putida]|nr:hypothetical protein L483_20235 [Pseudomonas putida H8234]MBP2082634.1 hypothetical protein [Pseudomonas sp. PvP089]MBP2091662.1 hypothetical protein [Pseudomonas sp. PvP088]MBP2222175.1 hypothetical protein [Pseudomonas putida]GLO21891.1 hypothetical protein PPUJ20188_52880 [Pseudomonas putida]
MGSCLLLRCYAPLFFLSGVSITKYFSKAFATFSLRRSLGSFRPFYRLSTLLGPCSSGLFFSEKEGVSDRSLG